MSEPIKLLFVDVDGVLVTTPHKHRPWTDTVANRNCVAALNHIVAKSGATVILSSSWRYCGYQEMRHIFSMWGAPPPAAFTPDLSRKEGDVYVAEPRWKEIAAFMDQESQPMFVILDDEPDMGPIHAHHIRTEYSQGLTMEQAARAVAMFGGAA